MAELTLCTARKPEPGGAIGPVYGGKRGGGANRIISTDTKHPLSLFPSPLTTGREIIGEREKAKRGRQGGEGRMHVWKEEERQGQRKVGAASFADFWPLFPLSPDSLHTVEAGHAVKMFGSVLQHPLPHIVVLREIHRNGLEPPPAHRENQGVK